MNDLSKHVTSDLASPVKLPGEYANDRDAIPQADLTQESSLPKGPDPSPFKLGPLHEGR